MAHRGAGPAFLHMFVVATTAHTASVIARACNTTHANACLFQRLRNRLDAAGLPSQWLDAEAPVSATKGHTRPPPPPSPRPVPSRLASSPPPPPPSNEPATDDSRLEPCVPPSGGLQPALEQEAARSREVLARLGAHACDGVGDECRQLGDATPASPVVCPLSGACRPSAGAAGVAASAPRIFAYDCMDGVHAQLLSQPHVTEFFDANLPRNQFVSEVALHRSLLASPFRTLQPGRADFFYIPFYSRLTYADRKATHAQRALALNATATLAACLRASPWWRRGGGKDHLAVLSSTRDPQVLYGAAWPLVRRAILLRIEAADRRFGERGLLRKAGQLVIPYYVPLFEEEHAVRRADKRHSVCFFGSDTNGLRRRALHALRNVPGAVLHLDSLEGPAPTADERGGGGGGSAAVKAARKAARKAGRRHAERRRTLASRVALRACKLCLVPAGITASSRRFYEASPWLGLG
jgi:hypothetical protein